MLFRSSKTMLEQLAETGFELEAVLEALSHKESDDDLASSKLWETKLAEVAAKITRLGPINLAAIDEYKEQLQRKEYLDGQDKDVTAALDILEISDPKVREPFIKMFAPLDAAIDKKLGGKKSYLPLSGRAEDTMLNFEIPFEEPEDIDDFMDEFQEKFESTFEKQGYIIAGFYNVKDSFNTDEDVMPDYVTFWAYDICHIELSYNVFDGKNGVPMAGIFAPCSMYVYVKEDENKIVIGMPSLRAWSGALGMTDPKKLDIIDKLDVEITQIIEGFGGKVTPNGNPLLR